ncbi:MAG: hypothetical protein GY751_06690 [Bacteroidetes bacterium]|nr:hypothetical protein [Bacteroidota bacterium]
MKSRKDLQKRIDDTMNSVKGIQPVGSNPFLFEKIKSRMQTDGLQEEVPAFHIPALRLAALCLLFFLNFWFIGNYVFQGRTATDVAMDSNIEYIMDAYEIETENTSIYN